MQFSYMFKVLNVPVTIKTYIVYYPFSNYPTLVISCVYFTVQNLNEKYAFIVISL